MTEAHLRDLTADRRNARAHNPRNVGMIATALNEVGAGRSIVIDEDGVILAGNATADAAAQAGIERVRVIETDGNELIAVRRRNLTPEQKAKLALYDNRTGELADWNPEVLAELAAELDLSGMFYEEELAKATAELDRAYHGHGGGDGTVDDTEELEQEAAADDPVDLGDDGTPPGSLLALVDVTLGEPRHTVELGQRYVLGRRHILHCCKVMDDWAQWALDLSGDDLFCPYPGPFVPLTVKAAGRRLVMVQPSTYTAGHILDRYADVHGEGSVRLG